MGKKEKTQQEEHSKKYLITSGDHMLLQGTKTHCIAEVIGTGRKQLIIFLLS